MDSLPSMPFYYLELAASQRTLIADMESSIRYWKRQRAIEERRIRADKYPDYLRVWDLREGWAGAGYEGTAETSYKEIAKQLKQPISSIHNTYRSAFELITGHTFSPEYWCRLFGPIKFSGLFTSPSNYHEGCYRRTTSYVSRPPIPESVVTTNVGAVNRSSFVDQQFRYYDDTASIDVLMDIQTLADQGRSNTEIARELELSSEEVSAVLTTLADRRSCTI